MIEQLIDELDHACKGLSMASGPTAGRRTRWAAGPPLRPGLRHDGRARGAARGRALPRHQHRSRVHAEELRAALGGLKGPLMKVAQLLATIPEALPKEYAAELAQLQSQAPPMGRPFVRRRMAAELGPGWRDKFADFELEAAAAASLGQVHRATALDGRSLACKLQYPSIESAVEADLAQLRLLFGVYRRCDGSINPERIYDELAERLREELDYRREAKHMALYRHMLRDDGGAGAGRLPELSSGRLLTMTWLDGRPLLELVDAPQEERNRLAHNMFRAWYVPFYDYAVIHGDPHLGNYTARPDLTINLIDFGCIRVFQPALVQGVIDLYWALVRGDMDLAVHAYETWGFAISGRRSSTPSTSGRPSSTRPDGEPAAADRGDQLGRPRAHGRLQRAAAAARDRRGHAAARVRADGPRRDRARLGVHAPPGRGQLAPAVHGADQATSTSKPWSAVRPRRSRRRACRCQADAPRAWRRSGRGFMVLLTSGP